MATLHWRVPHGKLQAIKDLLEEAEQCERRQDQQRLSAVVRQLELMPGFPRHYTPGDHFVCTEEPSALISFSPNGQVLPGLPY